MVWQELGGLGSTRVSIFHSRVYIDDAISRSSTQYTVDELMNTPDGFQDSEVLLRSRFKWHCFLDPSTFQLDGLESNVTVDYSKSPVPDGLRKGEQSLFGVCYHFTMESGFWNRLKFKPDALQSMSLNHWSTSWGRPQPNRARGELTCSIYHKSSKMVTRSPRAAQTSLWESTG